MRADCLFCKATDLRVAGLLFLALIVSGCKTEKDPDQPTLLGVPPSTAYLGVEYYYNWGAYGGEAVLDYTLTNAPSWLALEDTSNKAREGIIMRGVPGLSGGNRGEDDLGRNDGINIVTTDGRMAGVAPFDIEVRYNALALEDSTFTEGEVPEFEETERESCAQPDLSAEGQHTFEINEYNPDGSVSGSKFVTFPTRQVFVKLTLDQPSVTRVDVAFELSSEYDPEACEPGSNVQPPHQQCDHSTANASDAIIGKDIVGLGSNSPDPVDEDGQPLDYLVYETDDNGFLTGGVITLEPGITECYIRLEVVDDTFAESAKVASLALTEVRNGLAGLGETNEGVKVTLLIEDDEPVVSLETLSGGPRDTINVGDTREYRAVLTGEREGTFRARLIHSRDSSARLGSEFIIDRQLTDGTWIENDPELVFDQGQDEAIFRIRVPEGSYSNNDFPDRAILLALDTTYQAGRERFARAADDNLLRVSLNELTAPLALDAMAGFVPTDMAIAHNGRLFVVGYDSLDGNRVKVRIFDQKGTELQSLDITPSGVTLQPTSPVINTVQRKVSVGSVKVDRYEFVVAYSTDVAIPGTTAVGGADILTSLYWYDAATNGGEYVELWTTRTGTAGDDIVRFAGINRISGYVVLTGESNGTWPDETPAGGFDSFIQRIDTVPDGNNQVPQVAWTRQEGSASDDSVAGGVEETVNPIVFGSASGSVGGAEVIGGVDAFFFATNGGEDAPTVYQVGSDGDESVIGGMYFGTALWLFGNSDGDYSLETETTDDDPTLRRTTLSSQAGFLLAYSTTGDIRNAFTLNDEADQSDEVLTSAIGFDADVVVAGHTDGDFTGEATVTGQIQAILSRLSLTEVPEPEAGDAEEGEEVYRNEWRVQLDADDSSVVRVRNYRDDEITALTRIGNAWQVLLFSPEGRLLTP